MSIEPFFLQTVAPRPIEDEALRIDSSGSPSDLWWVQEHIMNEFNKRTEMHYDETGDLEAITLDGERFHINELLETPDEVTGTADELGVVYGQEREDAFDELEEYLHETGVENVTKDMMTEEQLPYIAWDDFGMPLLHGDERLEEKLGLSDDIHAVMTSNGVVVKMFTPGMHGISNDGITHD